MTMNRRHAVLRGGIVVVATGLLLAACGNKDESKAYDACLAIGKDRYPAAKFESKGKSAITKASDTSYTVRIPYNLDGASGTLECMLSKAGDGNFVDASPPPPPPATTDTTTPPSTTDGTTPPSTDTTTPTPAPVPGTPAPSTDTTTKP